MRHRPPGLKAVLLAVAHFIESILLARELARKGTTHLHNHFANSAATVGLLASSLLDIPWSFTIHGISETDYPAGLMLPNKVRAAQMVVCVSWFGRAQAMRVVAPDQWSKLKLVRCGLNLDVAPPSMRPTRSEVRIICVGRLSPEKGQTGLLHAFAALYARRGDVTLTLIGDGPDMQALVRLGGSLRLGEQVQFVGRLSEEQTLELIAASDILVLPSFMEGLPIVLMEAMSFALPVVASRVAGIPELVRDGENGLLFTPSRWDELESCVDRLAGSLELRKQLGGEGQRTVREEFDISRSADQLKHLFEELRTTTSVRHRGV
jgi:glycosyltransferase involved in cell wall biosynthesis